MNIMHYTPFNNQQHVRINKTLKPPKIDPPLDLEVMVQCKTKHFWTRTITRRVHSTFGN